MMINTAELCPYVLVICSVALDAILYTAMTCWFVEAYAHFNSLHLHLRERTLLR